MAQATFRSFHTLSDAWAKMEVTTGEIARTATDVTGTSLTGAGVTLEVTVQNSGQVDLLSFKNWDVFAQYYALLGVYYQKRLTYTTAASPGANQWTVKGIYRDAAATQAEIFEPGILDPGEYMVIKATLSPAADVTRSHKVLVATANGVVTSSSF